MTWKAPGQILTASAHPCYSVYFTLAVEQFTVDECLLEGYGPAVTSFSVFCSSSEQLSHRSCVQPLFHTFRHSSLLNTSLNGFNLFLFKIMLFLSHQKPCLCQIQLVLFLSNLPVSQRLGFQLFLRSGDCTFSPSSVSLGGSPPVSAGWSRGSALGFSLPLSLCFCISYYLMKILK